MDIFIRFLLNTLAILISAYLLPGVEIDSFFAALVTAAVLGIINLFIKPILFLLTLPLTILTFGLFSLVLNALLIQLASAIVQGFDVSNFWWAVLFSLVLSLVNSLINSFSRPHRHFGSDGGGTSQTTYLR